MPQSVPARFTQQPRREHCHAALLDRSEDLFMCPFCWLPTDKFSPPPASTAGTPPPGPVAGCRPSWPRWRARAGDGGTGSRGNTEFKLEGNLEVYGNVELPSRSCGSVSDTVWERCAPAALAGRPGGPALPVPSGLGPPHSYHSRQRTGPDCDAWQAPPDWSPKAPARRPALPPPPRPCRPPSHPPSATHHATPHGRISTACHARPSYPPPRPSVVTMYASAELNPCLTRCSTQCSARPSPGIVNPPALPLPHPPPHLDHVRLHVDHEAAERLHLLSLEPD